MDYMAQYWPGAWMVSSACAPLAAAELEAAAAGAAGCSWLAAAAVSGCGSGSSLLLLRRQLTRAARGRSALMAGSA
jgi:hypothetical protein